MCGVMVETHPKNVKLYYVSEADVHRNRESELLDRVTLPRGIINVLDPILLGLCYSEARVVTS